MYKVVNGVLINVPGDTKIIRTIYDFTEPSIRQYGRSFTLSGVTSTSLGDKVVKVIEHNVPFVTTKYSINRQVLHLGNLWIEAYSCLPASFTLIVGDDWKLSEDENRLMIMVPKGCSESELVDHFELSYFSIQGGSDDKVGNLIYYNIDREEDRDYDSYGEFNPKDYIPPTIDYGLATTEFLKVLKRIFPEYSIARYGDQNKVTTADFIEYTLTDFGKYRRPFINEENRYTLLSQLNFKIDIVIKDTVKYMNTLHELRSVEKLTNTGKFTVLDKANRKWQCSLDWGEVISDPLNQNKGNYDKQAGQVISTTVQMRLFSIPDKAREYYTIETIDFVLEFINKK